MDTNREKSGNPESASIRLRYSTQFSSGGRMQSIDTEISLPVGTSQETREQIIREAELGVEQLIKQIAQRGSRATTGTRTSEQTALRPGTGASTPSVTQPGTTTRPQSEPMSTPRQTTSASLPIPPQRTLVGESMPTTPSPSGEGRTVRLADFINVIKKRWNMSPKEAMDLLGVTALDGLNYRDIYRQLEEIIKQKNAQPSEGQAQARTSTATPIVEAPRSGSRNTPQSPPRTPTPRNAATSTIPGTQGQTALKQAAKAAPQTIPVPPEIPVAEKQENEPHTNKLEAGKDFAGSPKAPIPLHIGVGVVRDASAQSYKFDEEEGEEDYDSSDDEQARLSAQIKLDELKAIRGTNAASAERLTVLNNVLDSQISEDQLQKIIQAAWNVTSKKRLKGAQVEALVSWAKEDFFMEEVEAMLDLIEEGEI